VDRNLPFFIALTFALYNSLLIQAVRKFYKWCWIRES